MSNVSFNQQAGAGCGCGRRSWPMWKKILAYAVFAAGAMVCIWFIDRRVDIPGRDLPRPVFQQ